MNVSELSVSEFLTYLGGHDTSRGLAVVLAGSVEARRRRELARRESARRAS